MSLVTYIETLRERPEHIRRRVAFWYAFGFTAIVLVFWLASFSLHSSNPSVDSAPVASTVTPGGSLVAGVGALGSDLWSSIVGTKKVTYSEVIVTPGKN